MTPVPPAPPPIGEPMDARRRRLLAPLFLIGGAALVPWTVYLAVTLPSRHLQTNYYDVAWGGFDVALAAVLIATGVGLLRGRMWVESTATAAGTLLVCDAWFDVLTSTGVRGRTQAALLAVVIELPMAVVCFAVARHVEEVAVRAAAYARIAGRLGRRRSPEPEADGEHGSPRPEGGA